MRVTQMTIRMNLFTALLCAIGRNEYMLYYISRCVGRSVGPACDPLWRARSFLGAIEAGRTVDCTPPGRPPCPPLHPDLGGPLSGETRLLFP